MKEHIVTLDKICTLGGGSGFPRAHQGQKSGDYLFIKVSDMNSIGNEQFIITANNYIDRETQTLLRAKTYTQGATVFAKVGEALKLNRRRMLVSDTIIDNNMMAAKATDGEVSDEYLFYLLSRVNMAQISQTGSLPSVNQESVGSIRVFCPPLDEQERIVEILSDADAAISTAEKHLERFSISQKHHHDQIISKITCEHGTCTISQVTDVSIGSSKAGVLCEDGNYLVIDMGGVSQNGDLISQKTTNRSKHILAYGDLIVPKDDIGAGLIIGKAGFVDADNQYVLGDHVFKLSAKGVKPRYLQAAINSAHFRRQVLQIATGSAQLGINQANFVKLQVAMPPDPIQRTVASIYEDTKTVETILRDRVVAQKKQKRGLMQQLLTGKLRVPEK